jgi:hypothetical protein
MQSRLLSAEIDRLLDGRGTSCTANDDLASRIEPPVEELAVASRLNEIIASFPPVPASLDRRVRRIVRSRPVHRGFRWGWRFVPGASTVGTVALSALATTLVFLAVTIIVPAVSGGQRSWAQVMEILLGQTRVRVTPTLQASSTLDASAALDASALQDRGLPLREPLRDLVAAELLIGRAPSIPRTLPQEYALLEIAAVSYPDLPPWISQPFYIELCYGPETEGASPDLRLRQYRLLFRDFGGISGVQVASGAVRDMEQVDVNGATGMLLTLGQSGHRGPGALPPTYSVLWERDGLLLELETDRLSQERLLEIARSVR